MVALLGGGLVMLASSWAFVGAGLLAAAFGVSVAAGSRRTGYACGRCGRRYQVGEPARVADQLWRLELLERRMRSLAPTSSWGVAPEVEDFLGQKVELLTSSAKNLMGLTAHRFDPRGRAARERDLQNLGRNLLRAERLTCPPAPGERAEESLLQTLDTYLATVSSRSRRRLYVVSVSPEQLKVLSTLTYPDRGSRKVTIRVQMHENDEDLVIVSGGRGEALAQCYIPRRDWALTSDQIEVYDTLRKDGFAPTEAHQATVLLV